MAKYVVLERLNKLVVKGYVVRWEKSEQDTVRLRLPRAPDLTLFSDGRIWVLTVSTTGSRPKTRPISGASNLSCLRTTGSQPRMRPINGASKSFVRRIPKPKTLQSLKAMTVEDVWIRLAVWTVVIVLSATAVAFLVSGGWSA